MIKILEFAIEHGFQWEYMPELEALINTDNSINFEKGQYSMAQKFERYTAANDTLTNRFAKKMMGKHRAALEMKDKPNKR